MESTIPPSSPGAVSATPDFFDNGDDASLNSENGVWNENGSQVSVRALISNLENTGDDVDPAKKAASLPRTHASGGLEYVICAFFLCSDCFLVAVVGRSKSLRSPEGTLDNSANAPPLSSSRPTAKGMRLKDRVKSLFESSSKDNGKIATTDDSTKALDV